MTAGSTTWTGSVIRHPDGRWFLFCTGGSRTEQGFAQTIGYANSLDLRKWIMSADNPILRSDERWYETLETSPRNDDAFRDPWVFADPDGNGWHMLITAHDAQGALDDRGVVGHAVSADLEHWELRPPLNVAGQGFGQLEVLQVETVGTQVVLVFSCLTADTSAARQATGVRGGMWAAHGESLFGPFDLLGAYPLTDESLYAGRIIQDRESGHWMLIGFENDGPEGLFAGTICDPRPLSWMDGRLTADAG